MTRKFAGFGRARFSALIPLLLSPVAVSGLFPWDIAVKPSPSSLFHPQLNLHAQAAPPRLNPLKQADEGNEPPADTDADDASVTPATPSVPPLPSDIPEAFNPDRSGIVGLYPDANADVGVGHLRPKNLASLEGSNWSESPLINANWLRGVALPIYPQPGGSPWGWIVNGWLIPDGYEPIAIGRDAAFSMLHTYYAMYSFPVLEIREDGWFRFQYTPAGTAWSHVSLLNLGQIELTLEPWEDRFLQVGQVAFRKHGLSQALKQQPNGDDPLQSVVSPNSLIEPLDFDGDWMRVRVTQPADACSPLPGATTEEGWMRWRNGNGQSLIWYPAKGC